MNKYKIIERIYFNEMGEPGDPKYYIKELKLVIPFFGWKWWVYIKEHIDGYGDYYQVPIIWDSVEEAQEFIDTILCPELPRNKYQVKEVKLSECTKNDNPRIY
jgi:hypothetical protein